MTDKNGKFDGRAVLDVVLLLAFGFVVAAQIPGLLTHYFHVQSPALITLCTQGSFIVAIWLLLRWRRLGFTHIGLQRPQNVRAALAQVLAICAGLWLLSIGTEALGLRRDLSNFDALRGDPPYTVFAMLFYGILSAGFYEEMLFRGYLMHRCADVFGRSTTGWLAAILLQGLLFGFSHLHQGLYGALYTGLVSIALGALYVFWLRTLWVLIFAHGLYDALRMLYFHLLLTYGGLDTLAG